jgi:hypothetical protein
LVTDGFNHILLHFYDDRYSDSNIRFFLVLDQNVEKETSRMISFSKFSRKCEDHIQDEETKKCFCNITGKNCNSLSCPKEETHNP